MDVLVQFWDVKLNKVNNRCVNKGFFGKTFASHVLEKFETATCGLHKSKFIQVLSDGPNRNLKFLDLLNDKRKDESLNKLIFVGSRGLHTVSRAFQNAEQSTNWNIKKILMAMHKIFEKSSSCGADYKKVVLATVSYYPLLFSATRCVENADVPRRAYICQK